jgi:hypothetical protein
MTKSATIHLLLLVGFLFISVLADAQNSPTIVKGKITDSETGEPLPYVNLKFKNTIIGTITNDTGYYEIKSPRPVDSLIVSFIGYTSRTLSVNSGKNQRLDIKLNPAVSALKGVEVKYKGNPAEMLLAKVLDKKKDNNPEQESGLSYEAYNKLEFSIYNLSEKLKTRKYMKPVNFIFDYVDSTDKDKKPNLPLILAEKISDYYMKSPPRTIKEYVHGSRITGVNNESVNLILEDTYQNINVYDNNILVYGKSFPSPLNTAGLFYYKYYLDDSAFVDGKWCYMLQFIPRRKNELMFTGYLQIHDTTFAVKSCYLKMAEGVNVNFLKDFQIRQEFEQQNNRWVLTKEKSFSDLVPFDDNREAFYVKKTTTYREYNFSIPSDDKAFQTADKIIRDDSAFKRNEDYWLRMRHDTLSKSEKGIIQMVDTVKKTKFYKLFYKLSYTATTGYLPLWYVEFGQFYKFISLNSIEGVRFRVGVRTTKKFSERVRLETYGAIGTKDKMFKGGGTVYLHLNPRRRMPWNVLTGHYSFDLTQLGLTDRRIWSPDNFLASIARRRQQDKLVLQRELYLMHEHDWFTGFMTNVQLNYRRFYPVNVKYRFEKPDGAGGITELRNISTAEVRFSVSYTFAEKYFIRDFERISLNRRFPVFGIDFIAGIKGIVGSGYNYQHLRFHITQRKLAMGPIGYGEYRIEAGKIFGNTPWMFLEIHRGNETYATERFSFTMMNLLEYVSDQYAAAYYTHHFDGLLFNKIPGIKKLKWREVATFKWLAGHLGPNHKNELVFPAGTGPTQGPYMEASVGIENIFKLFRVDAVWRITQRDKEGVPKFGVRAAIQVLF